MCPVREKQLTNERIASKLSTTKLTVETYPEHNRKTRKRRTSYIRTPFPSHPPPAEKRRAKTRKKRAYHPPSAKNRPLDTLISAEIPENAPTLRVVVGVVRRPFQLVSLG